MRKLKFKIKLISLALSIVLCFGFIFTLGDFSKTAFAETSSEVNNDNLRLDRCREYSVIKGSNQ